MCVCVCGGFYKSIFETRPINVNSVTFIGTKVCFHRYDILNRMLVIGKAISSNEYIDSILKRHEKI